MQRINPIMSRDVVHDAVDVIVRKMASAQMRRMPVVSRDLRHGVDRRRGDAL